MISTTNQSILLTTIFLLLISVPSGFSQSHGLAIFSQATDNQPDTQPSLQLIFRNIGMGSVMDPIFNTLRRRWNSIRANPLIQALLVQPVQPPPVVAGTGPSAMRRYLRSARSVHARSYRRSQPNEYQAV